MKKYAIIDIDGCLNYYPECFLEWLSQYKNVNFENYEDFKIFYGKDYKLIKDEYRSSGIKRTLTIRESSKEFLEELRNRNYTIYIVTSRHDIENVYSDTEYWLLNNNLTFDTLFFINKKGGLILFDQNSHILVVDDDLNGLLPYKKYKNTRLYLFTKNNNVNIEGITCVNSWEEINKHTNG